jgi:succinate-semialdehyde dehydrogenase/glutarate-semialdehyde dehydrogenase
MSAVVTAFTPPANKEILVRNPSNGAEVGRAPVATPEEVAAAVARARAAQPAWAALSFGERARVALRAREVILGELDAIARLISDEIGKPVAESLLHELSPSLDLMQYFARHAEKLLRPEKIDLGQYGLMGRSSRVVYHPLGVVGIIAPWNFPWATPLGEIIPALMAGNGVVLKPSELTPLTALKIAEVLQKAGLPDGLLSVVTGYGDTGAALIAARPNKVLFTGSTATGKKIAAAAAEHLIPVVLELGGKDPMIVCEDANLEIAARAAVWGAFANAGQACASVERCYVQEKIAPEFIEKVVAETKKLRVNDTRANEHEIGSMSSERQLAIIEAHVEDARARGANILTGGRRPPGLNGPFYEPTVIAGVNHTMDVMREETFGPVLPIQTFKTEDEALKLANDTIYGLTAMVFTRDIGRGQRLARQIMAGTVMVNEVIYTHGIAATPWGGMKQSGYGRAHGRAGLLEMVAPQHVHVNRVSFMPDLWWFNYSASALELFRGFARRFASGSVFQTALLLPQMLKRMREKS